MEIVWCFLFFLVGLCCGSLANLVAAGLAREPRSFIASNCAGCGKLWPLHLVIPVAGYFMAKRRCPACGSALPVRILLVEITVGLLFAYMFYRYGVSWVLSLSVIYTLLLMILLITDAEKMLLPNAITYPGFVIALLLSATITLLHLRPPWSLVLPLPETLEFANVYFYNVLIGALCGFLLLLLVVIASRGGMALGDVKLAALIGAMVGFPSVLVALFLAVIAGGLVAMVLLMARKRGRKDPIPFGPFLCAGAVAAMLWGRYILVWYLAPLL